MKHNTRSLSKYEKQYRARKHGSGPSSKPSPEPPAAIVPPPAPPAPPAPAPATPVAPAPKTTPDEPPDQAPPPAAIVPPPAPATKTGRGR